MSDLKAAPEWLHLLHGRWTGRGAGQFSTIAPFEFTEQLRFEFAPSYPFVFYEQRARLLPADSPSHWEAGFIRPLRELGLELSNAQDSGRTEVLRGSAVKLRSSSWELQLTSTYIGNDSRLIATARTILVDEARLQYVQHMTTTTTNTRSQELHLKADLCREA